MGEEERWSEKLFQKTHLGFEQGRGRELAQRLVAVAKAVDLRCTISDDQDLDSIVRLAHDLLARSRADRAIFKTVSERATRRYNVNVLGVSVKRKGRLGIPASY